MKTPEGSFAPRFTLGAMRRFVRTRARRIPVLILYPKNAPEGMRPGVLWIHGGGYIQGFKEMALLSRAADLVRKFGAVVVAPGYRRAFTAPYPAAITDCYAALLWLKQNAIALRVRPDQIMVGGESAGGGLCAALCMLARDRGEVNVAYQMPLYPMLDNFDTPSSKDNHGHLWNTRRNHFAWSVYLRENAHKAVSPYASPSRQTDYRALPPCYTFVGDGEPFRDETLRYVENLRRAGVEAHIDVYRTSLHSFDLMRPLHPLSRRAIDAFDRRFAYAVKHYFAPQERIDRQKNS